MCAKLKELPEDLKKAIETESEKVTKGNEAKDENVDAADAAVKTALEDLKAALEKHAPSKSSNVSQSAPSMIIAAFVVIAFLMN